METKTIYKTKYGAMVAVKRAQAQKTENRLSTALEDLSQAGRYISAQALADRASVNRRTLYHHDKVVSALRKYNSSIQ